MKPVQARNQRFFRGWGESRRMIRHSLFAIASITFFGLIFLFIPVGSIDDKRLSLNFSDDSSTVENRFK